MSRAEVYQRYARQCVEVALTFQGEKRRMTLLGQAQAWLRLAHLAQAKHPILRHLFVCALYGRVTCLRRAARRPCWVAHYGQLARNLPDRTTTLTLASVLLLVLRLFGRAARNHRHF